MATEEYGFEPFRRELVLLVEEARERQDEDALARVLDRIAEQARVELDRVNEQTDDAIELAGAAQAWASAASYATTRFYFEGPESILKFGGFGKDVASQLQRVAGELVPTLKRALEATGASSFSISVGFPFGVSVGLSWG